MLIPVVSNPTMENHSYRRQAVNRTDIRAVVALFVVVAYLTVGSRNAAACECTPPPPPCVAYSETPLIFLGTVTETLGTGLFRMRIDKAYKGISTDTVLLFDDGMCDGPTLQVGEQYLMYTQDIGADALPSRGCTRSRSVKYAAEDLAFLNGIAGSAPTGTLSGQVTMSTGNMAEVGEPLGGATVELFGQNSKATVTTDKEGRYSFFGLEPGSYSVKAIKDGFSSTESEEEDSGEIEAHGCALVDMVLRKNWPGRIDGRVIRSDGSPAQAGLKLDLIRVGGKAGDQKSDLLIGEAVETDEDGGYSFVGVAPGAYKIVLNIYKVPTAENPYLTQYWPHATAETGANTVEINENQNSARCDFHLPRALESKPVQFLVLFPDGTSAPGLGANIIAHTNWGAEGAGSVKTDESGRFSFAAVKGFKYTAEGIMTDQAVMHPVHFSITDADKPITIRLVTRDQ